MQAIQSGINVGYEFKQAELDKKLAAFTTSEKPEAKAAEQESLIAAKLLLAKHEEASAAEALKQSANGSQAGQGLSEQFAEQRIAYKEQTCAQEEQLELQALEEHHERTRKYVQAQQAEMDAATQAASHTISNSPSSTRRSLRKRAKLFRNTSTSR